MGWLESLLISSGRSSACINVTVEHSSTRPTHIDSGVCVVANFTYRLTGEGPEGESPKEIISNSGRLRLIFRRIVKRFTQ